MVVTVPRGSFIPQPQVNLADAAVDDRARPAGIGSNYGTDCGSDTPRSDAAVLATFSAATGPGTTSIEAQVWPRISATDLTTFAHWPAWMRPRIGLSLCSLSSVLSVFLRRFTLQRARIMVPALIVLSPTMPSGGTSKFTSA